MEFLLKNLPREDALREQAQRYPDLDITAIQACLRLLRVGSDLHGAFSAYLARHGLSQGRFMVLMMLLRHEEGLRPAEVADLIGVTRATMTGLLSGLEKDGLILRREHEEDGRMAVVRLSAKGRQRLDGMLPDHYRRTAALMSGLSDAERQQFIHLLDKVAAGLEQVSKP